MIELECQKHGRVVKWFPHYSNGFILGDDGETYYVHKSDCVNCSELKKGNIVTFLTRDDGKANLRAVEVHKTGHGKHHPFYADLERIKATLNKADINAEEKGYRIRDIEMIQNYFAHIEDIEWCRDVRRRFRVKQEVDD